MPHPTGQSNNLDNERSTRTCSSIMNKESILHFQADLGYYFSLNKNAPRNLMKRSSLPAPFPLYMSHANILRALTKSFVDSLSSTERKHHLRHSDAVSLLSANPYFAGDLAQLKGQLWSARYLTVKIHTMLPITQLGVS